MSSELMRLLARRTMRLSAAGVLVAIGVLGVWRFVSADNDLTGAHAAVRSWVDSCRAESAADPFPGTAPIDCDDTVNQEAVFDANDPRFDFMANVPATAGAVGVALAVVSLILGASFAGAEWGTGFAVSLLSFEPRRGRLLGAKLIVAAATLGTSVIVAVGLSVLAQYPAASFRGVLAGAGWDAAGSFAGLCVRAGLVSALAAAGGVGLGTLFRNSAGAISLGVVYVAVVDQLLFRFVPRARPWVIDRSVASLLGLARFVSGEVSTPEGAIAGAMRLSSLPFARSILILAAYTSAVATAAYVSLRTRDIA